MGESPTEGTEVPERINKIREDDELINRSNSGDAEAKRKLIEELEKGR